MNDELLGELSKKMAEMAAANPAQDLRKNFRAMLGAAFAKLDLVSREEYDAQVDMLERARAKLAALESRVAELEARLKK